MSASTQHSGPNARSPGSSGARRRRGTAQALSTLLSLFQPGSPWQCWEDKGSWLDPESMRVATIQFDPTTSSGRRGGASLGGVSREAEIVAPEAG